MIEIRPIRDSEAERFLELMCHVFDLDYSRAHAIFFSEPMFDLERKWALFEEGEMTSTLTTVPLQFGWGRAIGIAGVATVPDRQGRGHAAQLLKHVLQSSEASGEGSALLFAKDERLYERLGFRTLDKVVRGQIDSVPEGHIPLSLEYKEVRKIYKAWSEADERRLIRDERRWNYWRWNMRVCTPFQAGYLCFEAGTVREVVAAEKAQIWPLPPGTEWLGLQTMAESVGVRLTEKSEELSLMGFNFSDVPQMFMTDQF